MKQTATLAVEHVAKEYETPAGPLVVLKDVSFTLCAGEWLAIVGPSGSGKSTLLNIVGSLDRPTSGRVLFNGECVSVLPPGKLAAFRSSSVGFVFQDHHLLPQCTALENVLVPTLASSASKHTGRAAAERLLARVGLQDRMHALPAELSGGERQRVAVARALINNPQLLLADEPTGSLDSDSADGVSRLLCDLSAETGMMLVVVTHNLDLARRLRRVCRLSGGVLHDADRTS